MNNFQKFIATSRYSRWLPDKNRRETWEETVARYIDNIVIPVIGEGEVADRLQLAILNLEVMPSMRALMTAGEASSRDNTCMYNCSYLSVDNLRAFDEAMFILMCGTGVGFSVERQYVSKLPKVPDNLSPKNYRAILVEDSKEGWARACQDFFNCVFFGEYVPTIDYTNIRPAGARLKTFGGRASGPEPLKDFFNFATKTLLNAKGRQLTSLECHDLMCKIGEVVVSGGVRRSAMISLSNLSDNRMRGAKSGDWYNSAPYRALSNNSAVYTDKPSMEDFIGEWHSLIESKSGERGIFNRQAAKNQASKNGRRDINYDFGTNPCSEIILRPNQFCNLTEVVIRVEDTIGTLKQKVTLATILGTIQATYTKFPYLRKSWAVNTREEALLGVSLTGIFDNPLMYENTDLLKTNLNMLREHAVSINKFWSGKLGINEATAITCVKPSGTVSQLVLSSSGIHPSKSKYYIRRVRSDVKDPITKFMTDSGIPNEPCYQKPENIRVFSFPIKSSENSLTEDLLNPIDHLKLWNTYQEYWCEHKPSVTITVKDEYWLDVGSYVYKNFDKISGVSFFPYSDFVYQQAPYESITESEYEEMLSKIPKEIDWSRLSDYEKEDTTVGMSTFACSGDICEVVDLV